MDKQAGLEHTFHRTKIVATVGPACDTYEKLLALVKAGVNVFRLNFSHGSHEDKAKIIENIRKINSTEPFNIAILGDLQGPKLRVGEIEGGSMVVEPGEVLTFTNEKLVGKDMSAVKDANGTPVVTGMIAVAAKGGGWFDYDWPDPVTKKIMAKSTYARKPPSGDGFIGVGIYKQ